MVLKFIAISDTHDRHNSVQVPPCDILIHTGDITKFGGRTKIKEFATWFAKQPAKHKICIAGNHDLAAEQFPKDIEKIFSVLDINYLCNSGVKILGINFYGTPVTPRWGPWAFMKDRNSPELKKHYDDIPDNTDVLLCHGPPFGFGDHNGRQRVGCELLLNRIKEVKPKLLLCGHIHESYGAFYTDFGTIVINSAQLNFIHNNVNKPMELIWEASHD